MGHHRNLKTPVRQGTVRILIISSFPSSSLIVISLFCHLIPLSNSLPRTDILVHFIDILSYLQQMKNFNSLIQLLSSLHSSTISKLKKSWAVRTSLFNFFLSCHSSCHFCSQLTVCSSVIRTFFLPGVNSYYPLLYLLFQFSFSQNLPKAKKEIFDKITSLMSNSHHYKNYHEALHEVERGSPCIPLVRTAILSLVFSISLSRPSSHILIAVVCQDLFTIEDSNETLIQDTSDGKIVNWEKMTLLAKSTALCFSTFRSSLSL